MKKRYWMVPLGFLCLVVWEHAIGANVASAPVASAAPLPPVEMSEGDVVSECGVAIGEELRDPETAEYKSWLHEAIKLSGHDNWLIRYPVRGQNSFGAYVTQTFQCRMTAGEIVKVSP